MILPMTPRRHGFTLVELLVSMAVVSLLLLALVSITSSTQKIWSNTTGKVSEFQDAREAFEAVTRRLSQVTLNTYSDYVYASGATVPSGYARQSELRYINGPASTLITASYAANCPGHAMFFQAPIGYTDDATHADLSVLLNTCGYFLQFGDDKPLRPPFVTTSLIPLRYRFRLMELVESSENLALYKYTSGIGKYQANMPNNSLYSSATPPSGYTGCEWFTDPFQYTTPPVQVRAENIVALFILPKLSPNDEQALFSSLPSNAVGTKLAPNYSYDSSGIGQAGNTSYTDIQKGGVNSKNQLPPIIQVTMVAVDEPSFKRFQTGTSMPAFYSSSAFTDATQYNTDLQALQQTLVADKFNFRVFTTNVSVKSAKWSRNQKN